VYRLRKMLWGIRALLLSPAFGRFLLPSYLGPPTLLVGCRNMFIERRVRIYPGLRAETHRGGTIHIGEGVSIGQNCHITAMGKLAIGEGTVLVGSVVVTDIDHDYSDIDRSILEQGLIYSRTEIGRNCFVGMGACIQAGTVMGDGCIVGANSVVRGEFPPHSVLVGAPARIVKRYDSESGMWKRC